MLPNSTVLKRLLVLRKSGEKNRTIFLHLLVDEFSEGMSFENHAGCEEVISLL